MSFSPPPITVSLCEWRDNEYHALHSTVLLESELNFAFESIGGAPVIANRWTITFPRVPKIKNATHIAFTVNDETMGMVTPLTKPISTRKDDYVHFPPGSITFVMLPTDENRIARVVK